ncbi:MAG: AAA family ATPase [Sulfurimonas sp.]|jgi:AAA15 family ATPase/GTPase|nr:AAA family ATPase [Sulfurimonas sp.]
MDEHLLREIEIKDFKCFKDFKAEGFKRVNLIGGKNNVGKTAFMEACYLGINTKIKKDFFHSLLVLELNRNPLKEFEILQDTNSFDFKFSDSKIKINNSSASASFVTDGLYEKPKKTYNEGVKEFLDFYQSKEKPLNIKNNSFISQTSMRQNYIVDCIDELKLLQKWDYLNRALYDSFQIKKIDVIKNKVMLLKDDTFLDLSEFGDGLKQFIAIFLSLYLNKDKVIFLDEIENGIHYSFLDKLWEIILKISKEQNVQVFATTHSKECIESYARVAKKLEDEDITYIKMSKQQDGSIYAGVREYDILENSIAQDHEVR